MGIAYASMWFQLTYTTTMYNTSMHCTVTSCYAYLALNSNFLSWELADLVIEMKVVCLLCHTISMIYLVNWSYNLLNTFCLFSIQINLLYLVGADEFIFITVKYTGELCYYTVDTINTNMFNQQLATLVTTYICGVVVEFIVTGAVTKC